jgi:hypothetical protein
MEARTGDAMFVVGPDYRILYWDSASEALTTRESMKTVVSAACQRARVYGSTSLQAAGGKAMPDTNLTLTRPVAGPCTQLL